jgi:hypothetical protein
MVPGTEWGLVTSRGDRFERCQAPRRRLSNCSPAASLYGARHRGGSHGARHREGLMVPGTVGGLVYGARRRGGSDGAGTGAALMVPGAVGGRCTVAALGQTPPFIKAGMGRLSPLNGGGRAYRLLHLERLFGHFRQKVTPSLSCSPRFDR